MRAWIYGSTILVLGIRWRRIVTFTLWPLYSWRKSQDRLDEARRRSGLYEEEKNIAPSPEWNPGRPTP
jgi:hypothetical protein